MIVVGRVGGRDILYFESREETISFPKMCFCSRKTLHHLVRMLQFQIVKDTYFSARVTFLEKTFLSD